MKKTTFTILIIIFPILFFGQNNKQKTLSKFIISDATRNGIDMTETILNQRGYIVFYTNDSNNLFMANAREKKDTQSFGRLYNTEHNELKETYESFEADIFHFNWRYINSYDTDRGTAKVELMKIYKPQGVIFKIKIITENLDVLVYKGYMEGTLDLNKFSN